MNYVQSNVTIRIKNLEKEARKAVSDNTWVRGQLMLEAIESVAAIHLPRLLAKFHGLYPERENLVSKPLSAFLDLIPDMMDEDSN